MNARVLVDFARVAAKRLKRSSGKRAAKAWLDYAFSELPPVAGAIEEQQASKGLEAVEAWCRWARAALAEGGENAVGVRRQLQGVARVLQDVRTPHGATDVRNLITRYLLGVATATGEEDMAVGMTLGYAARLSSDVKAMLGPDPLEEVRQTSEFAAAVRAAVVFAREGDERRAIWTLKALLEGCPESSSARRDAEQQYREWFERRANRQRGEQ